MRQKHVPQRTCVACRRKGPKSSFARIVRTLEGEYVADPPRNVAGRGAYLCRNYGCWEAGLKRGGLARGLKGPGTPESCEALLELAHREFQAQSPGVA